jgi:hypothetical protein
MSRAKLIFLSKRAALDHAFTMMRKRWTLCGVSLFLFCPIAQAINHAPGQVEEVKVQSEDFPRISGLLKSQQYKGVMEDREIVTRARLEPFLDSKKYQFYASMLVGSHVKESYTALTDYKLYAKLVPFIESATYSPVTRILLLEGGIWNWHLSSKIRFEEHLDSWIHFEVIEGHFAGMKGNIYFESKGEKGTLVYITGELVGSHWPPAFVIEQGAEIVFGFTARRMRSYIESEKKAKQGAGNGNSQQGQIPQPRSHF